MQKKKPGGSSTSDPTTTPERGTPTTTKSGGGTGSTDVAAEPSTPVARDISPADFAGPIKPASEVPLQGGSGAAGKIPIYRGTDRIAENAFADETGLLMSEAAQRAYYEGGSISEALRASQETHSAALAEWGGPDELAQAHSMFGTHMQQAYGPRSVMSFTTDVGTAKYFARGGPVYRAMIDPGEGIWQSLPGAGESEVLIPNMIEVERWAG